MKVGTKSLLFGVHQLALHPFFVLIAWLILYRSFPRLYELCAIITHDWGYWGLPNMDGKEGKTHPKRIADRWRRFGKFGSYVADVIIGHSGYYAELNGVGLSKLFAPDKLAISLYPKTLYLLLANISGEIREYMGQDNSGNQSELQTTKKSQWQWLIHVQVETALIALDVTNPGEIRKNCCEIQPRRF